MRGVEDRKLFYDTHEILARLEYLEPLNCGRQMLILVSAMMTLTKRAGKSNRELADQFTRLVTGGDEDIALEDVHDVVDLKRLTHEQ